MTLLVGGLIVTVAGLTVIWLREQLAAAESQVALLEMRAGELQSDRDFWRARYCSQLAGVDRSLATVATSAAANGMHHDAVEQEEALPARRGRRRLHMVDRDGNASQLNLLTRVAA